MRTQKPLLALAIMLLSALACSVVGQFLPAVQRPALTSPTLTATQTITELPAQPPTPAPTATRKKTLTVLPSHTATRSSPTSTPTLGSPTKLPTLTERPGTQTLVMAGMLTALPKTVQAALAPMRELQHVSRYFNPVGVPLAWWHNIPIMPQAVAGQEFEPHIYGYVATATLAEARQFYNETARRFRLTIATPPVMGFSGTEDRTLHSATYFSFILSIVLTSYDNDTGHVIVVIIRAP